MLPNPHSHNPPRISQRQAQKAFIILRRKWSFGTQSAPAQLCITLWNRRKWNEITTYHRHGEGSGWIITFGRAIVVMSDSLFWMWQRGGFLQSPRAGGVKSGFKVKLCEGQMFGERGLISCPVMWFAISPPLLPLVSLEMCYPDERAEGRGAAVTTTRIYKCLQVY